MFQLGCRARSAGRGLIPVRAFYGSLDPAHAGLDHWTLLIHGFNNSEKSIRKTWNITTDGLNHCGVDLSNVVLFYWPGDYSPFEVISAMNYPRTVPIATDAARELAGYLDRATRKRRIPLRLSFVAHSLGCLLVLETIRLLKLQKANIRVDHVLLMAAAVPEGFCVKGQTYGSRFTPYADEEVLYSENDTILKYFFQVGQEIANRFPPKRRAAVGRYGGPKTGKHGRWSDSEHLPEFDHGDYWKEGGSICHIAQVIAPGKVCPGCDDGDYLSDTIDEGRIRTDSGAVEDDPPEYLVREVWPFR